MAFFFELAWNDRSGPTILAASSKIPKMFSNFYVKGTPCCLRNGCRITEFARLRRVERVSSCVGVGVGRSIFLTDRTRWVWRLVSVAWVQPLKGGTVELYKRADWRFILREFSREGERAWLANRIILLLFCLLWLFGDLDWFFGQLSALFNGRCD